MRSFAPLIIKLMSELFEQNFLLLKDFCEKKDFAGWDPYDGLNSTVFQSLPWIRNSRWARLAWIQFFKRSPVNFRKIAGVPEQHNAKGLALFLTGYCNLYKMHPREEYEQKIHFLANKIVQATAGGYSGACWGYNFDWQARAFFQPKNTPTVVATSFVTDALLNAYDSLKENKWLEIASSSTEFVLKDLNRTYDKNNNYSFSYSPLDHTQVYNASLLGARLLSRVFTYTGQESLRVEARKAVQFACDAQRPDGSWTYGTLPYHQWIDNFHTGFNLECIQQYQLYTTDSSFQLSVEKGLQYYLDQFFTEEGISKYYNNNIYPIDIHSPAQLVVSLYHLGGIEEHKDLVIKVLDWTTKNMQSSEGYFFYQKKRFGSSGICYMRWAQAWMFYAFTYYFLSINNAK